MITYNNKDILKSFIGNKRVIKKYLNNKIVYGIPDFAQYYNIQGYDNYEVVGNPTIVDGVASGFSLSNYLNLSSTITSFDEIVVSFIPGTYSSGRIVLFKTGVNAYRGSLNWASNSTARFTYTNTSNDVGSLTNIPYTEGKENILKIEYVSTNSVKLTLSRQGESDFIRTITDIDIPATFGGDIYLGRGTSAYNAFNGSIDLNNTYIKVNGKYWFNGNSNYKELLDCNPNVYLQSDGFGQYIQTNIHATGDTEVSTSFSVAQIETLSSIFSSRTSYNTANFGLSSREQGVLTAYYNKSNIDIPNFIVQPNRRTYIDMIKNNISVDNTNYGSIANYASFTASIPLRFFALATSTPSYFLNGKLYRTNIVNGNDKYDFVPVPKGLQIGSYTIPSNGMFDIITQTFFENKGSGKFIWGVDL